MADVLYFFTENSVRKVKDPEMIRGLIYHKMSILNPDLSHVDDVEPTFWKLSNGKILPMSHNERVERLRDQAKNGIKNSLPDLKPGVIGGKYFVTMLNKNMPVKFAIGLSVLTMFIGGFVVLVVQSIIK